VTGRNRLFVLIVLFQIGLLALGLLAIGGVVMMDSINRAQRAARPTQKPALTAIAPATPTFTPTATPSPTSTLEFTVTPTKVMQDTPIPTRDETATPTPRPGENLLTALEIDDHKIHLSLENRINLGDLALHYPDQLEMGESSVVILVLTVKPQLASLLPVAMPSPSIKGRIEYPESGLKYSEAIDLFPVVRANISAPGFEIYRQAQAEQHILTDPDMPTIWSWVLVPRKPGHQTITLRISLPFRFTNLSDPSDHQDLFASVLIVRDIYVTTPAPKPD
jgi:hypothetical protein